MNTNKKTLRLQRKPAFYCWLMQYKKQNNAIGDLARDASDDFDGMGAARRGRNWDGTLTDLVTIIAGEANPQVQETMRVAKRKYFAWRAKEGSNA